MTAAGQRIDHTLRLGDTRLACDDDGGAGIGEPGCRSGADSTRTAKNDRHFSFEIVGHFSLRVIGHRFQ